MQNENYQSIPVNAYTIQLNEDILTFQKQNFSIGGII